MSDQLTADRVVSELLDTDINWELSPLQEPPPMSAMEQVVEATVDALSYRLLALEALDQLHTLTADLNRRREENRNLRQEQAERRECGRLRAALLAEDAERS